MKKMILLILASTMCLAIPPKKIEDMTCIELLNEIKTLEKYKAEQERGNYQELERIAAVLLTQTLCVGDFRQDGQKISVKQEIEVLKARLPDCNPY